MRQHRRDNKYEDADDDVFDEHGILKDGKSVRVPLTMLDGLSPVQRAVAQSVTDGQGGATGLHRPGFRLADADTLTTALNALDAAYRSYERDLCNAYKLGADAAAERSAETQRDQRSVDHQQTMDEVYASYDTALQEAWRT